jgi:hypothetical protein
MAQIFHHSTNTLAKLSIFGALFAVAGGLWVMLEVTRSPYVTNAFVAKEQPVPFSHAHHVGGIGIDCRYCHTSVEKSATAGIPPTKTCMNCHVQIWNQSPTLEPIRASLRTGESIEWVKVNDLPDFVYFNHAAHVNRVGWGIGCTTCHGRVDKMPLMWQEQSLQMEWCLECHRQPEKYVRPKEQVFSVAWEPPADQLERGRELVQRFNVRPRTSCSTCHR